MRDSDPRRHPRFAVQIDAVVTTARGETLPATTKDMSHGGICLLCPVEVRPGESLELSLSLTLGASAFSESIKVPARIVWCTPQGANFQVGAMFGNIDDSIHGFLEMFLRFLQQEVLLADEDEPQIEESVPNKNFDTGDADKP